MKTLALAVAIASLLCAALRAHAQPRTAMAEIRGCTDATITGRALPHRHGESARYDIRSGCWA
jgi:hypothetical protein